MKRSDSVKKIHTQHFKGQNCVDNHFAGTLNERNATGNYSKNTHRWEKEKIT